MHQLLFIGSTVADVVIRIPELPVTGSNLRVQTQHVNLGGCACNAFLTARRAGSAQCTLFSPVGSGVWGDWICKALDERGIQTPIPRVDAPNGCCYCLVEQDGERTFLSHHGAEYRFEKEWFEAVDFDAYDAVYCCGLELEEDDSGALLGALEKQPPRRLVFAPGPRLCRIDPKRMARMLALHPVVHLGEEEALSFTRAESAEQAAGMIHSLTGNDVIVTLGSRGAYMLTAREADMVPGQKAAVADTIGAGDSHIGAIMAAQADGLSLREAVAYANRVSAAVVGISGVELDDAAWRAIKA